LALSMVWTSSLWAGEARVEALSGSVDSRGPGDLTWQPLRRHDKIVEGTAIRTAADSDAVLLTDRGHRLEIKPNTHLTLTALQDANTETHLDAGRVLSKVKHLKPEERFAVQTPTAVCAVRGTEFETSAGQHGTLIAVYRGIVGIKALGGSEGEMALRAGQMTSVHNGAIDLPRPIPREKRARAETAAAHAARHEVALDMSRAEVIASAASERRFADYQEGKTLIDAAGKRVRLEEYIVRPAANQFKFVVLDEREHSQLDYFFYLGTFNQPLPANLSTALNQISGTLGTTAPSYYLTAYETGQSNTQDSVHDTATGGHLVKITQDGLGNYILTDPTDLSNVRTIAAEQLQTDGTYKVYNPLADSYSVVSATQKSAYEKFGIYLPENDTFRDLAPADTLWKTRFNTYEHDINNVMKQRYVTGSGITNVLTGSQDATWTYAGGFFTPVVKVDPNNIDATITNYYGDNTFETYRTLLIDDQGQIAPLSAFSGISSGAEYKGELLKWNYEQQVTASEFEGRKIDLVVEPKIFIRSGLIQ
jgi:hypothetical protein